MSWFPSATIAYEIRSFYGWDFRDDEMFLQAGLVYIGSRYVGKWSGRTLTLDRQAFLPAKRIEIPRPHDFA